MSETYIKTAREVFIREADALSAMSDSLNISFAKVINCLLNLPGHIITTGMGKSGHVAKKIAATLASTGSPSFFIHPSEAIHGDLGMLTKRDAILAFSKSGNTAELFAIIDFAARNGIPLIGVTNGKDSVLAKNATYCIFMPDLPEADHLDCAPTTSTIVQMALGDAIAVTLMRARGFSAEDFHNFHPGGSLGKKLLRVEEIMHSGADMPLVSPATLMREALIVMTGKRFGVTGVEENGCLVGIITDGDLRRSQQGDLLAKTAAEVMNPKPITVPVNTLVSAALNIMENHKIFALFVIDNGKPVGFFNIHDILRQKIR